MNTITSTGITVLATKASQKIVDSVFPKIKKEYIKYSGKLDKIIQNYLTESSSSLENVKTLLSKGVPKPLQDFYQPMRIAPFTSFTFDSLDNREESIDTSSASSLFSKKGNLIIAGNGGSGKTIFFKYLFLNSIVENYKIPIYLELRNYNDYLDTIEEFIYKSVKDSNFNIEKELFFEIISSGEFLFMFDAFDEVDPDKQNTLLKSLRAFNQRYKKNTFIISSRSAEGFRNWSNFTEYKICPLLKEEAVALVEKLDFDKEVTKEFIPKLNEELYTRYQSFASSPLLLNIMLLTFSVDSTLPDKLDKFYERAFVALFRDHDISKDRYHRKMNSHLTYDEVHMMFSRICFKSYIQSKYKFTFNELIQIIKSEKSVEQNKGGLKDFKEEDFLSDLEINLSMFIKDGLDYVFVHRSFQEYFAAVFVDKQTDEAQRTIYSELLKRIQGIFTLESFWQISFELNQNRLIKNTMIYQIDKLFSTPDPIISYLLDKYSHVERDGIEGEEDYGYILSKHGVFNTIEKIFKEVIYNNFHIGIEENFDHDKIMQIDFNNELSINIHHFIKEKLTQSDHRRIPITALTSSQEFLSLLKEGSNEWIMLKTFHRMIVWKNLYKKIDNNDNENIIDFISGL